MNDKYTYRDLITDLTNRANIDDEFANQEVKFVVFPESTMSTNFDRQVVCDFMEIRDIHSLRQTFGYIANLHDSQFVIVTKNGSKLVDFNYRREALKNNSENNSEKTEENN